MMKFIFNWNLEEIKNIVFKNMPLGFVLVLAIFMTTSLNSIHAQNTLITATANKAPVEAIVNALQDEVLVLKQDIDSNPSLTDYNTMLIESYTEVIRAVEEKGSLKQQMLKVLRGPVMKMHSSDKQAVEAIIDSLRGMRIDNRDLTGLYYILQEIRELKN